MTAVCALSDGCTAPPAVPHLCGTACWARRWPPAQRQRHEQAIAPPVATGPTIELYGLPVPAEPGHYVYTYRDRDGSALYVGSTTHPINRTMQHRAAPRSGWFDLAVTIEWVRYPNVDAMGRRELELIHALTPRYNRAHNPGYQRRRRPSEDELRRTYAPDDRIADDLRRLTQRNPGHLSSVLDALAGAAS